MVALLCCGAEKFVGMVVARWKLLTPLKVNNIQLTRNINLVLDARGLHMESPAMRIP